jgi:hypothetical protein
VLRDLHPTDGARYLLERDGAGAAPRVTYRATIYTPDAAFAATASLGSDGSVDVSASGAPAELHARLVSMAKLVARDAGKLLADGMPAWPARILRWRR